MIETIDKSVRYILKYKPFTYILSIFMAVYLAQLYPQSNTSLPLLLGLMFQNQMLRLILLISIIYISQYNFYLSSIQVIMLVGSYMLSDQFANIPLEGFTNNNSKTSDNNNSKTTDNNNSKTSNNNNSKTSNNNTIKNNANEVDIEIDNEDDEEILYRINIVLKAENINEIMEKYSKSGKMIVC